MNREYAEAMAKRLTSRPLPEQLTMAAQMLEQSELPQASVVHKQSMLSLAHALLDRALTEISLRLAAMGIQSQPKLNLPEKQPKKKPRGEW